MITTEHTKKKTQRKPETTFVFSVKNSCFSLWLTFFFTNMSITEAEKKMCKRGSSCTAHHWASLIVK